MGTQWEHWGDEGGKLITLLHVPMAQHTCPLLQALPYVRKHTGLPLSVFRDLSERQYYSSS